MGLRGPSFGSLHGASCPVLKGDSSDTPNHQQAVLIATEESNAAESGKHHRCPGRSGGLPQGGARNRGLKSRKRQGGEGRLFQAEGTAVQRPSWGECIVGTGCGQGAPAGRPSWACGVDTGHCPKSREVSHWRR